MTLFPHAGAILDTAPYIDPDRLHAKAFVFLANRPRHRNDVDWSIAKIRNVNANVLFCRGSISRKQQSNAHIHFELDGV